MIYIHVLQSWVHKFIIPLDRLAQKEKYITFEIYSMMYAVIE